MPVESGKSAGEEINITDEVDLGWLLQIIGGCAKTLFSQCVVVLASVIVMSNYENYFDELIATCHIQ